MIVDKILNKELETTDTFQTASDKQQLLTAWSIDAHYRGSKLEATILSMAADIMSKSK